LHRKRLQEPHSDALRDIMGAVLGDAEPQETKFARFMDMSLWSTSLAFTYLQIVLGMGTRAVTEKIPSSGLVIYLFISIP
jgi:hypothetical protein